MTGRIARVGAVLVGAALATGIGLVGCGGGDDGPGAASSSSGSPDVDGGDVLVDGQAPGVDGSTTDGSPPPPQPPQTFPAYAKALIDTKTSDTATPEAEQAWGTLADDDTQATSTALFPPAFFQ